MPRELNAVILWLIREKIAVTSEAILTALQLRWRIDAHTVEVALRELRELGAIRHDGTTGRYAVTTMLWQWRHLLDISLSDLAFKSGERSMRITPRFDKPHDHANRRDVFVLMPFKKEMTPIYQTHIKEVVVNRLKMTVARADDFFTANEIMRDIWAAIYHAKIIVADCTEKNANVFYEIGIAHTLGKPVILITQNSDDVPSDMKQVRYIRYEYTPPGMQKFEDQLERTIKEVAEEIAQSDTKARFMAWGRQQAFADGVVKAVSSVATAVSEYQRILSQQTAKGRRGSSPKSRP